MTYLDLIKRGPKPPHHRAPFRPVILCDRKRVAEWEAGWSGDQAWVWERPSSRDNGCGWLLVRWSGLDIDYGGLVKTMKLPDGSHAGFWRDYVSGKTGVKDLLPGAAWWSDKIMPEWLSRRGVIYPPDDFSQQRILDRIADDCVMGFGREIPAQWPRPTQPKRSPSAPDSRSM